MSDGYEGMAEAEAFRLAAQSVAAEGVTKAAGAGYSQRLAAKADEWMPLTSALAARGREIARRMDGHLEQVQRLYDENQAMKSAAAQMFDASLGREPRGAVPYDPELFELRTQLVPRGEPQIDGHGAAAPEGGHLWPRLTAPAAGPA